MLKLFKDYSNHHFLYRPNNCEFFKRCTTYFASSNCSLNRNAKANGPWSDLQGLDGGQAQGLP